MERAPYIVWFGLYAVSGVSKPIEADIKQRSGRMVEGVSADRHTGFFWEQFKMFHY